MPKIDALFDDLLARGASDLHLGIGYPPMLRLRGDLVAMRDAPISADEMSSLLFEITTASQETKIRDELDLDFAVVRCKLGGGEGGHNGLRDISKALGTRDYLRVRVGIGRPPGRMDPADFVLHGFSTTERKELPFLLDDAAEPDPGHREVRDADVHREHLHAIGLRRHHVRRPATAARRPTGLLPDQPGRRQLARQSADGAAVEAEDGGELAARGRTVHVHVPEQRRQVAAPDVFGPRPASTPSKDRHRASSRARRQPPACARVRRHRLPAAGRGR